jgi:hypothetical protein
LRNVSVTGFIDYFIHLSEAELACFEQERAANLSLYLASQIALGLDGVDRALDPGPSADNPLRDHCPTCRGLTRDAGPHRVRAP